jgi:hypothetical protein
MRRQFRRLQAQEGLRRMPSGQSLQVASIRKKVAAAGRRQRSKDDRRQEGDLCMCGLKAAKDGKQAPSRAQVMKGRVIRGGHWRM